MNMKRIISSVGLLIALTLTASGCSVLPVASNAKGTQPVPTVKKVADFDPAKAVLDPEWEAAFGKDRAVSTPIATAGLKVLSVMFDSHPEYTLGGFVPTDKEWDTVAGDFEPLVNAKALQHMQSEWNADKTLPVMSSYRSKPDKDGVHGYTYTTEAGEKCTDGDQPYEYKTELLTLTARPDASGNQIPIFSANVSLTVHCKEGGQMYGQMYGWFQLEKVDDKWIMLDTYEFNPIGKFKMMQIVG